MTDVDALLGWLSATGKVPAENLSVDMIAGDASPRRYYRVFSNGEPTGYVAVISPPTENNEAFLAVRVFLEVGGVRVPNLAAAELEVGFMLLEDLGDQLLLPRLNSASVDHYYGLGLKLLGRLAQLPVEGADLPNYDRSRLQMELDLFPEWFVSKLLDRHLSEADLALFSALSKTLIDSACAQRQVFVHRDFHSRNLMCLPSDELAAIDFQDAVIGPVTYDAVSLLKDCYVSWPRKDQIRWVLELKALLGDTEKTDDAFIRDFDLMGLQRHIKVLGIFARLNLRDGKSGYLNDLPLVLAYTRDALSRYELEPCIGAFASWFESEIVPLARQQHWFKEVAL